MKPNSPGCGCCGCNCCRRCQDDTPCTITLTTADGLNIPVVHRAFCSWTNRLSVGITYLGNTYERIDFSVDGSNKLYATITNSTTGDTVTWRTSAAVGSGGIWDCTANYTLAYDGYTGAAPSSTPGSATATPSRFQDCAGPSGPCNCNSCAVDPSRWKVVLSGIANRFGVCSDCVPLNGTYYLDPCGYNNPLCPSSIEGCCEWVVAVSPSVCGYDSLNLRAGNDDYTVWFNDTVGVIPPMEWLKIHGLGAGHDCMITDYSLFATGAGAYCDHSASTCLITAIP